MNRKRPGSQDQNTIFEGQFRRDRLGDGTENSEPLPATPTQQPLVAATGADVSSVSSPSRKKTNGYILFIYYRKNQVERETGSKITAGLPALMQMFNDDWNLLEEVEKEKWKNRARKRNGRETKPLPVDTDDWGTESNIWSNEYRVQDKVTPVVIPEWSDEVSMMADVKQICAGRIAEIQKMSFAIVNFNTYKTGCSEYIPAELGIVIFSIVGGMTHEAYTLIDPQLGDKNNCHEVRLTQKEYGLPSPDFDYEDYLKMKSGGPSDYKNILKNIQMVLAKSNDVCFALKSHVRFVDGCLNWILKKTGTVMTFRVYPLEYLVRGLMNREDSVCVGVNTIKDEVAAKYRLSNSPHMFREDLACDWHKQIQYRDIVNKCSLHTAKRQAYVALEALTQRYGIKCVDGIHAPVKLDEKPPYRFYNTDEEDVRVGPTSLEIQTQRFAAKLLKEKAEREIAKHSEEGKADTPVYKNAAEEKTENSKDEMVQNFVMADMANTKMA